MGNFTFVVVRVAFLTSRQANDLKFEVGDNPCEAIVMQGKANVESSTLWQRAFADEETDANVSRLVTSLRGIRSHAEKLTSRISGSLPGLTIHDISHLDALWNVASIVAGSEFPLNPLEGYIFGAAVLLHDAGLCFEAYDGGQDAIRDTLQWRDAYSRLKGIHTDGRDIEREADFEALRTLHASQAANLAIKPWGEQQNGGVYLIDDQDLRGNYGRLIGELASSHHWNLEQVVQRFSTWRPPAAFLEEDWVVDSLKIACMLRVADAGHMDGARAPSFLLKILQMNSVSRAHWTAQNHLGRLTVRPDNAEQLIIASTSPFPRNEAGAWWVAFDLVALFDKELRHCNEVLDTSSGCSRPSFARKCVTGAGQVRELAKYVETVGWEPTDSTVHVSDVSALVAKLGGEQLYGRDADRLNVALRELIQNATDAISARRLLPGERFEGQITVRLTKRTDGVWVLQVDDDGVGMSQTTLSTDLLDFGKSFWASERAAREFPGIHASGHSPIGHFGIGFFSIFMAAKSVNVFSRRFDKGLEEVRCLSFDNGISLRPTLSHDRSDDFGMSVCTRVELELKPNIIQDSNRVEIRFRLDDDRNFYVTFKDYVAAMVCGMNVPVFVEWAGGRMQVQEKFPPETDRREEWLRSLSYLAAGVNEKATVGLTHAITRLRAIRDGDKCYGLAAINVSPKPGDCLSGRTVGGLVPPHNRYSGHFIGLIDYLPKTAGRDPGEIAAPRHSIDKWLSEQVALLKKEGMSYEESISASHAIYEFGGDPKDVLQGILVTSPDGIVHWPMHTIGAKLKSGLRLGFTISTQIGQLFSIKDPLTSQGFCICVVSAGGKFAEVRLLHGVPEDVNSFIGVVHRELVASAYNPKWTIIERASFIDIIGQIDILEVAI